MRSVRPSGRILLRWLSAVAIACEAALAPMQVTAADDTAASAPPMRTTVDDVDKAVAEIRKDPNLGGERTERRLQFKAQKPRKDEPPAPWLLDLLRWFAEGGRAFVWLLGAVVVAMVLVLAWRWMRVRADAMAGRTAAIPPSHVNDLDIRPDSLPDDIAGTARTLWQRGEQRASLSLLYRGALSRLVHEHGVEIGGASTEGECLGLAQRKIDAAAGSFFEQLVGAWQVAVYASRWPEDATVRALFDGFDAHFAPRKQAAEATPPLAGAAA